ncbi:MAG: Tc toxin subunit A, partial [Pseudomonadota bacterium]
MSINKNLPEYAGLFGDIDFKTADPNRSVYSPAAYLTDLLQILDDEFDATEIDFNDRRSDVRDIVLNAENTTTIIPYLDIVNEILEKKVEDGGNVEAYDILKSASYPFNAPFSLDDAKLHNYLGHLGLQAHELRHLFATDSDNNTVARQYLGLSEEVYDMLTTASSTAETKAAWNFGGNGFMAHMAVVTNWMDTMDLEAEEGREILVQHLRVADNDGTVEPGRENFFINVMDTADPGFAQLDDTEENLEWSGNRALPNVAWFDRLSRFIRLAKNAKISFTDLDHILRHAAKETLATSSPWFTEDTIRVVAQVVFLHKTLEISIPGVCAILNEISHTGRGNGEM